MAKFLWVYFTISFLIGFLLIIFNSWVILSFCYEKRNKRTRHIYLRGSLSFADMLSGMALAFGGFMSLVVVFGIENNTIDTTIVVHLLRYWYPYILRSSTTVSFYSVSLMAILRCHSLKYPVAHRRISRNRFAFYILLTWVTGIVNIIFEFLITLSINSYGDTCARKIQDMYFWFSTFYCYILPSTMTL